MLLALVNVTDMMLPLTTFNSLETGRGGGGGGESGVMLLMVRQACTYGTHTLRRKVHHFKKGLVI